MIPTNPERPLDIYGKPRASGDDPADGEDVNDVER